MVNVTNEPPAVAVRFNNHRAKITPGRNLNWFDVLDVADVHAHKPTVTVDPGVTVCLTDSEGWTVSVWLASNL